MKYMCKIHLTKYMNSKYLFNWELAALLGFQLKMQIKMFKKLIDLIKVKSILSYPFTLYNSEKVKDFYYL